VCLTAAFPLRSALAAGGFQYVSPLPGARMVSPHNNVAVRHGERIDGTTVHDATIAAVGSLGGPHPGVCVLADDGRTIVFTPREPYLPGETVTARLGPGVTTAAGDPLPELTFTFAVSSDRPTLPAGAWDACEVGEAAAPGASADPGAEARGSRTPDASDLPPGYPQITLRVFDDPEPGCVFLTPRTNTIRSPLVIIDNYAMPLFYRRTPNFLFDLKLQNGMLTYYDLGIRKFYALDSTYAVVDSFAAGNGYLADLHDLQLLPNGHALLLAYDAQRVGMDTVVAGGNPMATVIGLIVQELDTAKNVVFQWRSWDHFEITDAVHVDLTAPYFDYVHGNAVELDDDGNLVISSRNMSEITKIDRQTGDIIWRWGLNAINNQFTFIDDPRGFSYQHDIRRAPNGHMTVFDNGNYLDPEYSRALEYELDEDAMTARLVSEYRPVPDGWASSMGGMQRRESGGTMIGWGAGSVIPDVTDLHPDGTVALELAFNGGMASYRAFRFPWRTTRFETDRDSLDFGNVLSGHARSLPLAITHHGPEDLVITSFVSSHAVFSVDESGLLAIPPEDSAVVHVTFQPIASGETVARLYVRAANDTQLVARVVTLRGVGVLGTLPASTSLEQLVLVVLISVGGVLALTGRRSGV